MIIENSTSPVTVTQIEQTSYRLPVILGTIITLTAVALPLLFIFSINGQPTGSLLSPLPAGEVAETVSPSVSPTESPIVAAPEEKTDTESNSTTADSNADRKLITLPAGKNEIAIRDATVTTDSYIYIVPVSATNDPVYVKTKGEGYFIIRTNKASDADLLLEYYILKDE